MNFINKLHNLLIFLSFPEMESRIIIILKYVGDIANMLGIKGSGTFKALRIYQDCRTLLCNNIPRTIHDFETLQMVQSLLQRSIRIEKNCINGGDRDLRSSLFHRQQFKYLLKKSILQSAPQVHSWQRLVLKQLFLSSLVTPLEAPDIEYYVIQKKYVLIEK